MIMNPVASSRLKQLSHQYGEVGGRPTGERFHDAFQRYLKANRESLFEPPRVLRRLQLLREWSHEQIE